MKKKLLILILIGTVLTFFIYFYTKNDNLTLVSLGDGLSIGMTPYNIEGFSFNDYLKEDFKIKHKLNNYYEFGAPNITLKELIYSIKENETRNFKNKRIEIKRAIYEADILTISIGMDYLSKINLTKNIRDEFKEDFEELLSIIKTLNTNKVIVLGLYTRNNQNLLSINKINSIIRDITLTNNFIYIDIAHLIEDKYYLNINSTYLNYEGHKAIYKEIKKYL